jgi:hypothetical protein
MKNIYSVCLFVREQIDGWLGRIVCTTVLYVFR